MLPGNVRLWVPLPISQKTVTFIPKEEHLRLGQRRSYIYILIIFCGVMAIPALAQVDQGRIAGTVKDQTGAVIPGVEITVRNDRTGEERKVVSADRGDYLVVALKPSQYTVFAELSGFAKAEVRCSIGGGADAHAR